MGSVAISHKVGLEIIDCCSCGVVFAIPDYFLGARKKDGKEFCCPSGHRQHFAKSEVDKLRGMLESANLRNTQLATQIGILKDEVGTARMRAKAEEKARNTILDRIKVGVCPHCNRTFKNVARHMETKHRTHHEAG